MAICLGLVVWALQRGPGPAPPAQTPPLPKRTAPAPRSAWLGLNYNSGSGTGTVNAFSARGIVYDREGDIEVKAGDTPDNSASFKSGLKASYGAGMIPDIEVDPGPGPPRCSSNPLPTHVCLPTSTAAISAYVDGFAATAAAAVSLHRPVMLEPMDEPWGWASPPGTRPGRRAADEYAAILARLLPALAAAAVPLADVYVPADGELEDGSQWVSDLYQAQPCLKPGAGSCGPIEGWSLHAYGLPHRTGEGIDSVPGVRAVMLSGRDNLIVSELGFCSIDVNAGRNCNENRQDIDGTSAQTSGWLQETLVEAGKMHRAGWLRALLLWERSGNGGWAMQNNDGTLTAQGRVLDLFAASPQGR